MKRNKLDETTSRYGHLVGRPLIHSRPFMVHPVCVLWGESVLWGGGGEQGARPGVRMDLLCLTLQSQPG